MARIEDLLARLDALLDPQRFEDYGPNGLQIPGRTDVERVVTGVTATKALIDRAAEHKAHMVLVHHGLFWGPLQGLTFGQVERIRPLLADDMALVAYHLPLDAHPQVGNNALLAEALGCTSHDPFVDIGRVARFEGDGIEIGELLVRLRTATGGREPLLQGAGPARVRTLGLVSGGAAKHLTDAIEAGLDAFLTGEPREAAMAEAEEAGVHFIAAGHYATETFGVRRLGELLAAEFGVEHVWVDLPNPV